MNRFLSRAVCVVAGGALILSGCARNYVTRHHELHLISQKTEIAIGKKAKDDIVKQYGQVKDLDWQIYLDEVGQRVAKASDRPNLQYDFTIIDSDELNAFAVPGGFIFVTRGILYVLADEAELAVVLGHEITHVAAWHGIESLQRAGLLSTLTALGMIGGVVVGAGEAAVAIAQAAGIYENLYLLGYGRDHELEADRYGIYYASQAGYDPGAALTFFQRLDKIEKEEQAGQHLSPYWQDHPPTQERLQRAKKWIAQAEKTNTTLAYNRDKFLSMVAKLPQGVPAERGVIQARHYTNVPFQLQLDIPPGWTMDNTRQESLVTFRGPKPEVRGSLDRTKLVPGMTLQDFGKQTARQWGLQQVSSREANYPAGHALVWQYGGDYMRYRTLLLIKDGAGYTLTCEIPADDYLQYIVDCEKIMRAFGFTDGEPHRAPVAVSTGSVAAPQILH